METSPLGASTSCLPAQELRHPLTLQLMTSSVLRMLLVMGAALAHPSSPTLKHSALSHSTFQTHQTALRSLKPKALNSLSLRAFAQVVPTPSNVWVSIACSETFLPTPSQSKGTLTEALVTSLVAFLTVRNHCAALCVHGAQDL